MVLDIFSYNGEAEILEIRLNILYPYVDQFIIVEAPTTFSGHEKPLYFAQQFSTRFEKFQDKIKYYVIDEDYIAEEMALAEQSPNTHGAAHWKHEFLQKENIKKALAELNLKDDDICFIGDVDEIWSPFTSGEVIEQLWKCPLKLKLLVYTYYINNRSSENFWGTIAAKYSHIKDSCLNHIRSDTKLRSLNDYGWHFTSMGGYEEVKRKLNDSYTEETYNNPHVRINLEHNIEWNKDFLGRDFTYTLDESEWPQYLKDNGDKYKHLLK